MKIAILSIGDEVIFGEIVDTNAAHISSRLYDVGLKVQRQLSVGDSDLDIIEAIESLAGHADFVIATGGLGPTVDDITARAAAKAAGRRLVLNDEALAHLHGFYKKAGRDLLPASEKQCLLPAKTHLIPNPSGTASGFVLAIKGTSFFFLPGVPVEMKRMLEETVIPAIMAQNRQLQLVRTRVLKVFGLSEPEIENLLQGVARPDAGLTIAYCVMFPEVQVKLRAEGKDEAVLAKLLAEGAASAAGKLGDYLYGEGDDTIDSVVARLFADKGVTLSLAESCTGGLVAKRITDLAGSSAYFMEGAVTYSNAAKTRVLAVPAALLEEQGAVSSAVAISMAKGIRRLSGSDIALSVTGIAGPEGGTADKPVGTVFLALAGRSDSMSKRYNFFGDRERIRTITSFTAIDWLRRYLLTLP
ncbi:MAG: competence/damage-inducible protein A [Deltaproteobacteria bacterium]|jgi:nicotinamide-nucleotide amidase